MLKIKDILNYPTAIEPSESFVGFSIDQLHSDMKELLYKKFNCEAVDLRPQAKALDFTPVASRKVFSIFEGVDAGEDGDGAIRTQNVLTFDDIEEIPFVDAPYFPVNGMYVLPETSDWAELICSTFDPVAEHWRSNELGDAPFWETEEGVNLLRKMKHLDEKQTAEFKRRLEFDTVDIANERQNFMINAPRLFWVHEFDSDDPLWDVMDQETYQYDRGSESAKNYYILSGHLSSRGGLAERVRPIVVFDPLFYTVKIDWRDSEPIVIAAGTLGRVQSGIISQMNSVDLEFDDLPPSVALANDMNHRASDILRIMVANSIMNADPEIVERTDVPPRLIKKAVKQNKGVCTAIHTINLTNLRYKNNRWISKNSQGGVAWHCVRGHFRKLNAEQYTQKRGQRVWVRPHTRGKKSLGKIQHNYVRKDAQL